MFWNYLIIALRNLRKNRIYTLVNLVGLTLGLTIFLFGSLLVRYEINHDRFFANSDRIYTLGSIYPSTSGEDRVRTSTIFPALAPIIESNIPDIEKIARTLVFERVVSHGDRSFYENVTFADKELLDIFDFDYLYGDKRALDKPGGMVLSEQAAIRYFGRTDVIGEVLSQNNRHDSYVRAVIRIPENSHFSSGLSLGADSLEILGSLDDLENTTSVRVDEDWNRLWLGNFTYVLTSEGIDPERLENRVEDLLEQFAPEEAKNRVSALYVEPIARATLLFWDSYGIPVLEIIQLLVVLVLITSCINYTNLAVAQSLGRSREVGMRKVVGATRGELLGQFISESVLMVFLAVVCATAILELIIPLFNSWTGSLMQLQYAVFLPWLFAITLVVGLISGGYPAWLVARSMPVEALRDTARKGRSGSLFRSLMVGLQFGISFFMLVSVMTVFVQNQRLEQESHIFPKEEVFILHRLEAVNRHLDTLQSELQKIPGVETVAFSSQVPYERSNRTFEATIMEGDRASKQRLNRLNITPEFFNAYDIPLLAGRMLDRQINNDQLRRKDGAAGVQSEKKPVNVIVNELTLSRLGISSSDNPIGQRIFPLNNADGISEAIIVGVVPTQNIQGFISDEKPWMFVWDTNSRYMDTASIRLSGDDLTNIRTQIEDAWTGVIADRPMRGWFLDESFERYYRVLETINQVFAVLALVALLLTFVGLFGLTHFYSVQRTREIGLRRVLGASVIQLVYMLLWQFSRPVIFALAIAMPVSYLAATAYLNLFGNRFESLVLLVLCAGFVLAILSSVIVVSQAARVARANPVNALRYE